MALLNNCLFFLGICVVVFGSFVVFVKYIYLVQVCVCIYLFVS